MTVHEIRKKLWKHSDQRTARVLQRFFKTGPGEYGEGDVFLGIRMPVIKELARIYQDIPIREVTQLLKSSFHEERMLALQILIRQFSRGTDIVKKRIYQFYLSHTDFVNNWDLVDVSAEHIVGAFLMRRSRRPLFALAKSKSLWERRIAIISTFHFIKLGDSADALKLIEFLLSDDESLLHKACGWMLREISKRDMALAEEFLDRHCQEMPRTMLRYALEKLPETKRQFYLSR